MREATLLPICRCSKPCCRRKLSSYTSTVPGSLCELYNNFKLDGASERFLNLAGPALETPAAGCPWPCMPIVSSLWAQKVEPWSDFSSSLHLGLSSTTVVMQWFSS